LAWVAVNVSVLIAIVAVLAVVGSCVAARLGGGRLLGTEPCAGGMLLELAPFVLPAVALGLSATLDTFALHLAPSSTSSGQYQFAFGVVTAGVAAFMGALAGDQATELEKTLDKQFGGKFNPTGSAEQQDAYRAVNEGAYGATATGNNQVQGWDWSARRERISQISLALKGKRC